MPKINILGQKFYIKLLRAARFKKGFTIMNLLPWDKDREHLEGLRPAQKKVVKDFAALASATAGLNLADRMYIIGKIMKFRDYGGIKRPYPYPKLRPEELSRKIEELSRLIAAPVVKKE